jgi:hypothetical protein
MLMIQPKRLSCRWRRNISSSELLAIEKAMVPMKGLEPVWFSADFGPALNSGPWVGAQHGFPGSRHHPDQVVRLYVY